MNPIFKSLLNLLIVAAVSVGLLWGADALTRTVIEKQETEAVRRASIDCAMEAMFTELGMEITDADIDKIFEGADSGEKGQKRSDWEDANRMANIRKMCRQRKVTSWLVDNAVVTVVDDEGNVIEEASDTAAE